MTITKSAYHFIPKNMRTEIYAIRERKRLDKKLDAFIKKANKLYFTTRQ